MHSFSYYLSPDKANCIFRLDNTGLVPATGDEEQAKNIDREVSLLVDISGSMQTMLP
jgi:hypothetical protein